MRIVIVGAGIMGLCSAMLLAGDSHEVLVLDRDREPPPDPDGAAATRTGVRRLDGDGQALASPRARPRRRRGSVLTGHSCWRPSVNS